MNKEFITEALRNDRALKAHRLVNRFEKEVRAEIRRLGQEIVEENPHLFPDNIGSNIRVSFDDGTIIAFATDNLRLKKVNKDKPSKKQKLNISLRWVDPIDWGEQDVDGAFCAACYKVNNGHRDDFERVKQDTQMSEWNISFGDDQYNNAPGILYIPVASGDDLQKANAELQDHFAKFGDYWGVDRTEVDTDA